jgi:chemotaxis protein CheD
MPREPFNNLETVRIAPGHFCTMGHDGVISTLLGSCVAACLYDPIAGLAGMNHFLLSNHRYARNLPFPETEAGRYGIHAMELLINELLQSGAKKHQLRAKVFGGASIIKGGEEQDNFSCVGAVNSRFILEFMETERIPLLASDLGGDHGRVIFFDTRDYAVYVRKIKKSQSVKLVERDRHVWQRELREHERVTKAGDLTAVNVELWK